MIAIKTFSNKKLKDSLM